MAVVARLNATHSMGAAGDLYDVAGTEIETPQVCRRQTRDRMANVLHASFSHAQQERSRPNRRPGARRRRLMRNFVLEFAHSDNPRIAPAAGSPRSGHVSLSRFGNDRPQTPSPPAQIFTCSHIGCANNCPKPVRQSLGNALGVIRSVQRPQYVGASQSSHLPRHDA
jgi:hypothetical protein